MIARYTRPRMGRVWTNQAKFHSWLQVELAVIEARCNLGIFPANVISQIRPQAKFRVREIIARDKVIEHDLQAFVDIVRSYLPPELQHYFHQRITSYDTETPALSLQFTRAGQILLEGLDRLIDALRQQASAHMWTFCMGITHGQDAEPTTFGWRLCGYLDMMEQARENLARALDQIKMSKCSGAVGNWLHISPAEEEEVLRILGLTRRPAATQIVPRDAFARVLSEIAITGGSIEKIATDLRFLATTAYKEVKEPRKRKQKGSSSMPHKINTILLERMSGMPIALRGYAVMGQELARTWLERDISHSCVERIVFPDATDILDYMLDKMTKVISGMIINREVMALGINRTRGCWASEAVKTLLGKHSLDMEDVYYFIQTCAFDAMNQQQPFRDQLIETDFPGRGKIFGDLIPIAELDACFDFRTPLEKNLPQGYERMKLNPDLALPANL